MNVDTYQQEALRTERGVDRRPDIDYNTARLLNGLMGLNGEAGEAIDILKKHLFQGHTLDKYHLAKELGDIAWYLAVAADALGYDLSTIFEMNVHKLRDRYPDGFEAARSLHREDGDI
jgi:NTP pyrophosphatase (non-canonical NTP hydrolase)